MIYSYRERFGAILRIANSTELGTPSGLPLHRGQGEIRVKALEGEAILFIYVREE